MYAIIAHGGKQYRVAPGDRLEVERVAGEAGSAIEFADVRLVERDGELSLGKAIGGVKVLATLLGERRGDKVLIFKKKRRKQYRRTRGHRQDRSLVRIERIE